ncbi:MAG: sterol desaturase family protein [Oligoflexia bacterium]|nr:sterol desaturase family protein [Oligoflexia bacterium]
MASKQRKSHPGIHPSIRVFQNPILERLTHVHPLTPWVVWIPVVAWLLTRSREASLPAMAASGLLTWTLAEYLLHRFVFHFRPRPRPWGALQERALYLLHGLHHEDPQDSSRLVMPPVPGLLLAALLFAFFRLFLDAGRVEPFFAFFLLGYLWYDTTHFAVHHFTPRTRYGRWLKRHHMLHHYGGSGARFGVSTPLWDHVFNTLQEAPSESRA